MFKAGLMLSLADRISGPMQRVIGNMSKMQAATDRQNKRLVTMGTRVSKVGGGMTKFGAVGTVAFGAALRPVMTIEDELAKVQTVAAGTLGSVEADVNAVKEAGFAWGRQHKQGAAQFIATSYDMISAGLDTRAAIEATQTSMTVATATIGKNRESAQLLSSVYLNMGDRMAPVADEMGRIGDQITKTQQLFKFADLGQLAEGLKYGVPAAKVANLSLDQLLVAVGQLNNAGLEGGQAGTAFAASLRQMDKAAGALGFTVVRTSDGSLDLVATLDNLKGTVGSFASMSAETRMALQTAFGDEGLRAISAMVDKTGEMRTQLDQVAQSAGAAAKAQAIIEGRGSGRLHVLKNKAIEMLYRVGLKALPILERLLPVIEKVADSVLGFVEANPGLAEMAVKIGLIGSMANLVLGPILSLGGGIMQLVGKTGLLSKGMGLFGLRGAAGAGQAAAGVGKVSTAATAAGGRMAAAFGRVGGGLKTLAGTLAGKVALAVGMFITASRVLGPIGRRLIGNADISASTNRAQELEARAASSLGRKQVSHEDKLRAQEMMERGAYLRARSLDIAHDVRHGSGFGGDINGEMYGGVLGGGAPAKAPRQMYVGGRGAVDVVRPPGGRPAGLQSAGAAGETLRVQDKDSRDIQQRMVTLLEEMARQNPEITVNVEQTGATDGSFVGQAARAGATP